MNASPLLSVRHLRVEIPTRHSPLIALDDVSFDIARGEILGFVGESGAGKSLTGMAVLGLLDPPAHVASGQIIFDGEAIQALPPARMRALRGRRIAAVFQDPLLSLNPLLTVGDQLIETLCTHLPLTAAEARERAVDWLRRVGIPSPAERVDAYPHQFSGGMRQRIAIAIGLACRPRLLIADEPTTALDVTVQAGILALLDELRRESDLAVLFITHDLGVLSSLTQRAYVFYAGRAMESGPTGRVLTAPRHPYTDWSGSPTQNTFL